MISIRTALLALLTLFTSAGAFAAPTHYEIDTSHSAVQFKVKHNMISQVPGSFKKFKGTFQYDAADPSTSKADIEIDVASIDTAEPKRDKHLKDTDFFDVKKYPTAKFVSKEFKDNKLSGDLTLHGVTKPVTLDVEVGGEAQDPWGNQRAGFTGTTKINRKDFGINWNKTLDKGGVVVGDEVTISFSIEGIAAKAKDEAAKDAKKKK